MKQVHIEQTALGAWAVVRESIDGRRTVLGTFQSYENAARAAREFLVP